MADLKSLIRLRRHSVDEKQKALAELYRQVEALEERRQHLLDQLKEERMALGVDAPVEMLAYFGRFSDAIQADALRINQQLRKLEVRVRIAQEDMREAFANLKRVEIVQQNRDSEQAASQKSKETTELDAIGIEGFRRNKESD